MNAWALQITGMQHTAIHTLSLRDSAGARDWAALAAWCLKEAKVPSVMQSAGLVTMQCRHYYTMHVGTVPYHAVRLYSEIRLICMASAGSSMVRVLSCCNRCTASVSESTTETRHDKVPQNPEPMN
jgi:hypothetical protein